MANTGKTVATLLIGAAVGAAVGYIIATDDKKRKEDLDKIKDQLNEWADAAKDKATEISNDLRKKAKSKTEDLEKDIYST